MAKGRRICCPPGALARCKALPGCDNAHGDVLRGEKSSKADRTKDHRAHQAPLPPQCRPRDLQTLTKSSLRATRYAHGQSESGIRAPQSAHGQSESGVRAARSGHGHSRSPVRVARTAHGPSEAAVRTAQSAARADRSPVCRWQSPDQAATVGAGTRAEHARGRVALTRHDGQSPQV